MGASEVNSTATQLNAPAINTFSHHSSKANCTRSTLRTMYNISNMETTSFEQKLRKIRLVVVEL